MVKPEMAEPGSVTSREQGVERMIGRQAKVFSRRDLRHLRAAAKRGRFPLRDDVIVLLAARAGLRACEIARLTWGMVLDPTGKVSPVIEVRAVISKRGAGRRVPMHRELRRAIKAWKDKLSDDQTEPDAVIVPSLRGGGPMKAAHRQLVRRQMSRGRPHRLFVAFGPPHLHHQRRAAPALGRRQLA